MSKIRSFYSQESINTSRQINADILRMVSVLFMVVCHCVIFLNHDYESGWYLLADNFFGAYTGGAPAFMLLMGFGIVYSRNSNPKSLFIRGIKLFVSSIVLNILKVGITILFIQPSLFFEYVLLADILHFAGLTFMALALFRKLKVKSYIVLIIAIVLSSTAFLFYGLETGLPVLDSIINYFIPTSLDYCGFSFASWFIFVVVGMFIGNTVQRIKNLNKFYLIMMIVSFVIAVPGFFVYFNFCENELQYYGMSLPFAVCFISSILFLLSAFHFLAKVLPNKIVTFVGSVSKNTTIIFFIHWCVIGPFVMIYSLNELYSMPMWLAYIIGIMLFIASYCLSIVFQYIKKAIKQKPAKSN